LSILSLGFATLVQTLTAQTISSSISSQSKRRSYITYLPKGYQPETKTPLVIALHSDGSNAKAFMKLSEWNAVADSVGFAVVYPNGWPALKKGSPPDTNRRNWCAYTPAEGSRPDDSKFLQALVDTICTRYAIDKAQIYVVGYAQGGWMAYRFICETKLKVAGVASVAGSWRYGTEGKIEGLPLACAPPTGMHVMFMRGETNSQGAARKLLDGNFTKYWLRQNTCDTTARIEQSASLGDTLLTQDYRCGRGKLRISTVLRKGHGWYASATSEVWRFFSDQPSKVILKGTISSLSPSTTQETEEETTARDPDGGSQAAVETNTPPTNKNKLEPQPANEKLTVHLEDGFGPTVRYYIFDASGVTRGAGEFEHRAGKPNTLDIRQIPAGTYRITFSDEHGNSWQSALRIN
jgi:poly(3-hydroxybutyrate) depolymerase